RLSRKHTPPFHSGMLLSCTLLGQSGELFGKSLIAHRYNARAFAAGLLDFLHLYIQSNGLQAKFLCRKGKLLAAFFGKVGAVKNALYLSGTHLLHNLVKAEDQFAGPSGKR